MANYNLDKTWEVALSVFQSKNPQEIAWKANVEYDAAARILHVPFLGTTYLVKHPEGEISLPESKGEVSITNRILILHYLTTANGQAPENKWISFKELPDGAIYNDPFIRRTIKPMLNIFSAHPENLVKIAEKLGGKRGEFGDVSAIIPAFPQVSIAYVIWVGDEEFPASGTVLFDASAKSYLPTEDYALLAGTIIWTMKAMLAKFKS